MSRNLYESIPEKIPKIHCPAQPVDPSFMAVFNLRGGMSLFIGFANWILSQMIFQLCNPDRREWWQMAEGSSTSSLRIRVLLWLFTLYGCTCRIGNITCWHCKRPWCLSPITNTKSEHFNRRHQITVLSHSFWLRDEAVTRRRGIKLLLTTFASVAQS